jgi:Copper type II ascorbate-dependent monooxygenase, C-terminal domain
MIRLTIRRFFTRTTIGLALPMVFSVAACGSSEDTGSPSKGTGGSTTGGSGGTNGGTGTGTTGSGGSTTGGTTTGGTTTGGTTTGSGGSTTGGTTTGSGGSTTGGTTTGSGGSTTGGTTTGSGGTTGGAGGAAGGGGGTTGGAGGATGGAGGTTGGTAGTGGAGGSGGSGTLPPPAAGTGIQIQTKPFTVMPGQELFKCYHAQIPLDTELDVAEFESVMSTGSHHFILYRADGDTAPLDTVTDGGCSGNFSTSWVYSSGQPHYGFKNPPGVAMVLNAKQRVGFDMHYLNTTSAPINAVVTLNMLFATGTFVKAAPLISFNTGIAIPPNGTQTVTGECTPGAGANFYMASTHTHKRGVLSTIHRLLADGTLGEELVHTTDWEKPDFKQWQASPFLTFKAGEKFRYSCSYQNDRNNVVTVGNSAELNEMCMAVTYFFPASAAGTCR